MADNKIIIELQSKDSATGQITSSVREMEVSLKNLESTGSGAMSSIQSGSESSIASFGRLAVAVGATSLAIAGLKMAFTEGIKAAEDFNQKTISIAAALTNMAAPGQGSFKEMFERNVGYAQQMFEAFRVEGAKHFANANDMMTIYNKLVQGGYAVRVDEVKYVAILADKIKLATQGQANYTQQLATETNSIMEGQARTGAAVAQELRTRLGPAWADILEQHKQAGTYLEFMASLWPGISAAVARVTNGLTAQTTTLEDNLKKVGREGLAGAYQDIVVLLKQVNEYLEKHGDILSTNIKNSWENIGRTIKEIFNVNAIGGFFNFIEDRTREFSRVVTDLKSAAQFMKGDFSGAMETQRQWAFKRYEQRGKVLSGTESIGHDEIGLDQTKIQDKFAEAVDLGTTAGIKSALDKLAAKYKIPSDILAAVAQAESGFKQSAISPKGAIGVMQLMPGTAKSLGVDPYNTMQNLEGGTRYLAEQIKTFGGDIAKALAAYNWGPNQDALKAPGPLDMSRLPKETRDYVGKIMGHGRGFGDIDKAEKEGERAAREQEKEQEKIFKAMDRLRKRDLKEQEKDAADSGKIAQKLHDEGLKDYLQFINNKKRLDTEATSWTVNALQTVMQDEKLSYDERLKSATQFKELRVAQIDDEITKLQKQYGPRIGGDILQSYKKAQMDQVNSQIKKSTSPEILDWEAAWKRAAENVQDAMADMIYNMLTQSKSAGDLLKNMLQTFTKMFSQMAAQAVMGLAKTGLESMGGGAGILSSLGGLFGFGGSSGGGYGAIVDAIGGISWAGAEGGILGKGFTPIGAYASGGVFTKPTLGLIGERGPEAVVPLKDYDRHKSGGDVQIINVWDPAMVSQIAAQTIQSGAGRKIVLNVVNQDLAERGITRKLIRR